MRRDVDEGNGRSLREKAIRKVCVSFANFFSKEKRKGKKRKRWKNKEES